MKAFTYEKYGTSEQLTLKDVPTPDPKENELLIKVHAVGLNAADKFLLTGQPIIGRFEFGLLKPKRPILGGDVSGRVEAVGAGVTQFSVGDDVFCDLSSDGLGGFAEYVCAPESICVLKSADIDHTTAASLPMSSVTALQGLRKGNIESGQRVLVHGASGGVGTFAVQIAKALGAEVTGMCSTGKVDLVRGLGADAVIDYTQEDFVNGGQTYDLVLVVNGNRPIADYKSVLTPTGNCIIVGGAMKQLMQAMIRGPFLSKKGGQQISTILAKPNQEDLAFVQTLVSDGKVSPVIDKTYSFNKIPDAFHYLVKGRAKGKVIINVSIE